MTIVVRLLDTESSAVWTWCSPVGFEVELVLVYGVVGKKRDGAGKEGLTFAIKS
jgi:hypothetical protein